MRCPPSHHWKPDVLLATLMRHGYALLGLMGCLCLLSLLTPPQSGSAADPTPAPLTLQTLPDRENIHHQAQYCPLCHESNSQGIVPSRVYFGIDFRAGCRCHYNTPDDLRHPTDVLLPDAMRGKMPASFPLTQGKMDCRTCHSFEVLCAKPKPSVSSLRGAPYPDRNAFCFQCHDAQQYERLNPHRQLDDSGRIVEEKCLYCHTKKPDEKRANFKSIKLIGGLEMLCQGCHNISDTHCGGKPHMVRPDLEYLLRIRMAERRYGVVLPLDENGKMTCVTCHNPHEAGVIPQALAGAKGADAVLRHRIPRVLCAECHWNLNGGPGR